MNQQQYFLIQKHFKTSKNMTLAQIKTNKTTSNFLFLATFYLALFVNINSVHARYILIPVKLISLIVH